MDQLPLCILVGRKADDTIIRGLGNRCSDRFRNQGSNRRLAHGFLGLFQSSAKDRGRALQLNHDTHEAGTKDEADSRIVDHPVAGLQVEEGDEGGEEYVQVVQRRLQYHRNERTGWCADDGIQLVPESKLGNPALRHRPLRRSPWAEGREPPHVEGLVAVEVSLAGKVPERDKETHELHHRGPVEAHDDACIVLHGFLHSVEEDAVHSPDQDKEHEHNRNQHLLFEALLCRILS
mmetsp:Transcript_23275/g.32763  ORF Transcript_23275/g.32763 Transcript_23275/m.32763 type:complete len:234 (-) Transcript_23275:37-738(-)